MNRTNMLSSTDTTFYTKLHINKLGHGIQILKNLKKITRDQPEMVPEEVRRWIDDDNWCSQFVLHHCEVEDNHSSNKNLIDKTIKKTLEGALDLDDFRGSEEVKEFILERVFHASKYCLEETMMSTGTDEVLTSILKSCNKWRFEDASPRSVKSPLVTNADFRKLAKEYWMLKRKVIFRHTRLNARKDTLEKTIQEGTEKYEKMIYNSQEDIATAIKMYENGLISSVGKTYINWAKKYEHDYMKTVGKRSPKGISLRRYVDFIMKSESKKMIDELSNDLEKKLQEDLRERNSNHLEN